MHGKLDRLATLGLLLVVTATDAARDDQHRTVNVELAPLPVVVVDDQGDPVLGAKIKPYAMRMKERDGHGYWSNDLFGVPRSIATNHQGVAVIEYPPKVPVGPELLTTRQVTFVIRHPEFVKKVVYFDLGPQQAKIALKPGCEVLLTATDDAGKPVNDFGVVMAGPFEPDSWVLAESGGRRTRAISDGKWQTMLVRLQEDGPTLFSRLLTLPVRRRQTVRFRNIPLRPGAVVRGKLSDEVPRPASGYVVSISVPSPANSSWNDRNPSLLWYDWTDVTPDGSFRFESLPRGGQVQLIAICDGWISKTTVPDALKTMGQLIAVDSDHVDVVLAMEPTGTVEVLVQTRDGKPFTEGRVASSPNQRYYKGGSTLLGRRIRSASRIKDQLESREARSVGRDWPRPYVQQVDQDGCALLTGLPVHQTISIGFSHDQYKLYAAVGAGSVIGRRGSVRLKLPSTEPVQLKIKVRKEGK